MHVIHLDYLDFIRRSVRLARSRFLDKLDLSEHYSVQISHVLRLLILMEHGGVYMDSDVVSLRAVPSDINNFVTEGAF